MLQTPQLCWTLQNMGFSRGLFAHTTVPTSQRLWQEPLRGGGCVAEIVRQWAAQHTGGECFRTDVGHHVLLTMFVPPPHAVLMLNRELPAYVFPVPESARASAGLRLDLARCLHAGIPKRCAHRATQTADFLQKSVRRLLTFFGRFTKGNRWRPCEDKLKQRYIGSRVCGRVCSNRHGVHLRTLRTN